VGSAPTPQPSRPGPRAGGIRDAHHARLRYRARLTNVYAQATPTMPPWYMYHTRHLTMPTKNVYNATMQSGNTRHTANPLQHGTCTMPLHTYIGLHTMTKQTTTKATIKQAAKQAAKQIEITATDAKSFAHSVFIVDSAATARELIDKTVQAWRKAGVRMAPRFCPNRAIMKAALLERYDAKRVPDILYCIALAINEGVPFSTNKKTMTDKVKAKGVKLAPNKNKSAGKSAPAAQVPSKAVVTTPAGVQTTGQVLAMLTEAIQKVKGMTDPALWEKAMKLAPVGTASALDELIKANS
jgi:hypothetical protein